MTILNAIFILILLILSFIAGLMLDNYYCKRASLEIKEALERQFVRLRVCADADDPVKPYGTPQVSPPVPKQPISQEFMDKLQQDGRAKTAFRKSDLS